MEVCIKWRMHKCSIQCTITTCGKMLELFMFSLDRQMTQHDVFQRVVETTKWLVRRCLSFVSELIKGSLWWHRYLCDLGGLCSNISRLNYDCPVFDCVVLIYFCRMLFLSTLPSMVFQPSEIAFYASHWDELLRKVLCVVAARIDMQYSHTYYIYIYETYLLCAFASYWFLPFHTFRPLSLTGSSGAFETVPRALEASVACWEGLPVASQRLFVSKQIGIGSIWAASGVDHVTPAFVLNWTMCS